MEISLEMIKQLRQLTSAGINDCKKVLEQTNGNIKEALELLRKKGLEIAAKKAERTTLQGRIESYVHLGNKIGVLVEINCETDFVAKNDEFCQFAKDIAMQIAAINPRFLKKEDVPRELLKEVKDKELFYKENCLLEQVFIKDQSLAIKDLLTNLIAKIGENIVIRRFMRFQVGENLKSQ